ncbi:hypothetical protein CFI00_10985 [Nocardioides sp. S5]|nr:hypothetical protein CFI00_10985 [Nocardioides sp. S5]
MAASAPDLVAAGVSVVVALVVLGPALLAPGSVLRGDMVFVPQQPWKGAWLGLDGSVPRAVPMDALVSVATQVVPGGWLQKIVLLASFVVAGTGIGRLVRRLVGGSSWAVVAAVAAYLWNPWVVERLSIGQWATVTGYALLPWVVLAAWRGRDDTTRWPALLVTLVLSAVCSPSSGLTAALVAVAVVVTRWRAVLVVAVCAVVANAPWLAPALTLGDRVDLGGAGGFASFGARAESSLGVLASVLSLGGIWKESVVPAERTSALVVAAALLLSAVAVLALVRARVDTGLKRSLLATGGLAVTLVVVPAWAPDVLADVSRVVPATSILRDSHRYLAPLALVLSLGVAVVVTSLRRRAAAGQDGLLVPTLALVAAPALLLPSAVWGLTGDLRPVTYPGEWDTVSAILSEDGAGGPGDTIVLPWVGSYRRLGWNDSRASLDPAPRLLPGEVLIDDRIVLPDRVLPGEDPRVAQVSAALDETDAAQALSDVGVRWVLVEKPVPPAYDAPPGTVVHDGRWLTLVDLGPAARVVDARAGGTARTAVIVAADAVAVLGLFVAIVTSGRRRGYAPSGRTGE